jgi:Bifunctional DNA primase/polymerase, N-terminal/Protein of unknown function (DUF3631)
VNAGIHNIESTNILLVAALNYARRGWFVFPVHSVRDGACTCGKTDCRNVAKHPCIKEWQHNASKDPDQIKRWWTKWPEANIGIACGPSRLIVLDEDIGHGGAESLVSLERQHGPLPATMTVNSGGGGQHRYFTRNGTEVRNSAGVLGPGLDIRGDGGFIVAPPSQHRSGNCYKIQESSPDPVLIPGWLVEEATKGERRSRAKGGQTFHQGERHDVLLALGGGLVRRDKSRGEVVDALLIRNRQCSEPWTDLEVITLALDVYERYSKHTEVTPPPPMTETEAKDSTAVLVKQCREWILRYVILTDAQATVLAFWLLHTYTFTVAECTPYMHIKSPERECGKSRLLRILAAVAHRPELSGSLTAAFLVRTIDEEKPTLFLDEIDATMNANKERAEDIRGALNSGYECDGTLGKLEGRDHHRRRFSVYCPKAFAGIGGLHDTTMSRSIPIDMRRKLPHEKVERERRKAVKAAAAPIREQLERWAGPAMNLLERVGVQDCEDLGDRQTDSADPLLAIAALAGGDWPKKLRDALRILFGEKQEEDSVGAMLLSDIRDIFDRLNPAQKIFSENLACALAEMEGRPWAEWGKQERPITKFQLAALLKRFKIFPHSVWLGETKKGYERRDFEEAWARYCPYSQE